MKNQKTKKIELANRKLEESFLRKKLIKEDVNKLNLINQIIQMDQEFNNDQKYLQYEKKYALTKIKKMLSDGMGVDVDQISDDMVDKMMNLAGAVAKQPLTPEIVMKNKNGVKNTVKDIMTLTNEDGDHELSARLQNFLNLLNQL
jgi:hypothetical protein